MQRAGSHTQHTPRSAQAPPAMSHGVVKGLIILKATHWVHSPASCEALCWALGTLCPQGAEMARRPAPRALVTTAAPATPPALQLCPAQRAAGPADFDVWPRSPARGQACLGRCHCHLPGSSSRKPEATLTPLSWSAASQVSLREQRPARPSLGPTPAATCCPAPRPLSAVSGVFVNARGSGVCVVGGPPKQPAAVSGRRNRPGPLQSTP